MVDSFLTIWKILVIFILLGFFAAIVFVVVSYRNTAAKSLKESILKITLAQKITMVLTFVLFILFGGFFLWHVINTDSSGPADVPWNVLVFGFLAFLLMIAVIAVIIWIAKHLESRKQHIRNEETKMIFERVSKGLSIDRPLFVFLRHFSTTEQEKQIPTEKMVIELFEQHGTLVCVDEPGFQYGMGRLSFLDKEWQPAVLNLCKRATAIIIYPATSEGTFWELTQLMNHDWLDHTFFYMAPNRPGHHIFDAISRWGYEKKLEQIDYVDLRINWESLRSKSHEIGIELPKYNDKGGLFRIVDGKVEWVALFNSGYLIGKPATKSLERFKFILDELIANR